MPELPEVETIRQDLRRKVLHTKIAHVTVVQAKAVRQSDFSLPKTMVGEQFDEIERVGKLLMFHLKKPNRYLLVHLKMTGQLIYSKNKKVTAGGHSLTPIETLLKIDPVQAVRAHQPLNWELPDKHTQIIITFQDGGVLYFNDMRRFGYARIVSAETKEVIAARYGIEPLSTGFTLKNFAAVLETKKTNLKALLLNQEYIAGIGNIYADEICHAAGVLPGRNTKTLKPAEIRALFAATKKILVKAVKERGTTFNNYVDGDGKKGNFVRFLKVYEREGEKCLTCKKEVIHKKKIAGRGTHFCPRCQR